MGTSFLRQITQVIRTTLHQSTRLGYRFLLANASSSSRQASQITRIQASQGWGTLQLREVWQYRDLIYFMLWSDIKARYRQMALGPLWIVIQPLFTVITSTVIFSVLAKLPSDGLPYPLFNYAALLPWSFFTAVLARTSGTLLGYQHLISKVYFPRLILPILSILTGLPDFAISLLVLLLIATLYGFSLSLRLLLLPLFLLLAIATATAIGLWLAALMVRFRDVGAFLGYFTQAWMYATPIVYPASIIPQSWHFAYYLNPMTTVVVGFRWCLFGTGTLPAIPVCLSLFFVLLALITGPYYYRSTERTIVDIV